MDDSIAQVQFHVPPVELATWKTILSVSSAVLLALLFLSAGLWKIGDPYGLAQRLVQAKVPAELGLFAAVSFGIAETFAAVLLLAPNFRRWGAWLTGALLVAFMLYIGYHYQALRGEECSCFPWLKRAVGPGFFLTDGIMLLLAVVAGVWAKPSRNLRSAMLTLVAITTLGLTSFADAYSQQTGTKAPETITVGGKPFSYRQAKLYLLL
ncbi:MAG: MauE/DoxX family redox-associated membrane protein [Bryobacteraceae bacterium]